jgi:tellurite methyltransferase
MMSADDRIRWETRYKKRDPNAAVGPRPFLVRHSNLLPKSGLALDYAMGLGGNSGFLLDRGLKVLGIDISYTAVLRAKSRYLQLMGVVCDLEQFHPPANKFDVVLIFYYLDRNSWDQLATSLKPGGVLMMETFLLANDLEKGQSGINPAYLLAPGELRSAFPGLNTLAYEEKFVETRDGPPRLAAGLAAKKTRTSA